MAQCVYLATVDGISVLAAEPAASGACSSLVVLNADEFANWQNNPLNLSASDGFLMSVAIIGIWGAAFGWRAIVRTLDNNDGNSFESS